MTTQPREEPDNPTREEVIQKVIQEEPKLPGYPASEEVIQTVCQKEKKLLDYLDREDVIKKIIQKELELPDNPAREEWAIQLGRRSSRRSSRKRCSFLIT